MQQTLLPRYTSRSSSFPARSLQDERPSEPIDLHDIVQLGLAQYAMTNSISRITIDDLAVHRVDLVHGARLRLKALEQTYLIGLILYRTANVALCGEAWRQRTLAICKPGEFEICTLGPCATIWLEVPQRLLDAALPATFAKSATQRVTFGGSADIDAVRRALEAPTQARERVLAALEVALRSGEFHTPSPAVRERFELLRQAEAFMWAHVDEPFEIEEVAAALNCRPRKVEYCFSRCCGCGPMRYFRLLRLNAVRAALATNAPRRKVIDVAADYGFWHLGHFGTAYRELFGETPLQTRARKLQPSRRPSFPRTWR